MAKYILVIKNYALKELSKLYKIFSKRIANKIDMLAEEPYPIGVKKLVGEGYYRLRVGDYRIIYSVNRQENKIVVYRKGTGKMFIRIFKVS